MTPYFDSEARRKTLRTAVSRWEGSSFSQKVAKPGVAGCCVGMVADVLEACGLPVAALGPLPQWSPGHGMHHAESQLLSWLLAVAARLRAEGGAYRLEAQPADEAIMVGDLVVLKAGQTPHHLAICEAPGRLAHIHFTCGFVREPLDMHRAAKSLHSAFRIYTIA